MDSKNFLASGSVTSFSSVVNVFLSVLNPPAEASDTLGEIFNPPLSGKFSYTTPLPRQCGHLVAFLKLLPSFFTL